MSTTESSGPGRPERPGGRPARPATPMVAVVIAAVAGVLGLLILNDVKEDSGGSSQPAKTTVPPSTVPETTLPTSTTAAMIRTGATIVVANASGQDGVAGALTTALGNRGYTTGKAVTATLKADATVIMVKENDAAAAAVARTLLLEMGLPGPTQPLVDPPVKSGDLGTATILVVLGRDKAGQPLMPLAGATTTLATATSVSAAETTTATTSG